MRYRFYKLIVVMVCTFSSYTWAASFVDPIDGKFDVGDYLAENAYGFLPVPVLITEPAVGYGGGVVGLFLHESEEAKEKRKALALKSVDGGAKLLTPAITLVGAIATDNGTKAGMLAHRHTWGKDSIRYQGALFYGDVYMNFYAPFSQSNAQGVELEMQGYGVMQKLQFRVSDSPLFIGAAQRLFSPTFKVGEPNRASDILKRWVNTSPFVSGLGLNLEYDTKNAFLYPTEGGDYTLEYTMFNGVVGSDYDFNLLAASGIHYFPLGDSFNLGFKGLFNEVFTDERFLPPPAYPFIDLRGIPRNRYQGNVTASVEAQLTWKMTPRWSLLTFGGGGAAASSTSGLFSDDIQYAYGVGFRYLIARRYGLHSGVDIATSRDDNAIYFQVGTGF